MNRSGTRRAEAAPGSSIFQHEAPGPARGSLPPAGYVLASALLPAFPFPVRLAYAERLRFLEPAPAEQREARAALLRCGFLLPCGNLTAEGREAARKALETV